MGFGLPDAASPYDEIQPQLPDPRQQQAEMLARQQEAINAQKAQAEARKGDLDMSEHMVHLLDPNIPKPARQFLYKEPSSRLGVDPKGDTSKNVGQMLLGLDPEAMEGIRRNFASKIETAKPGEITQMMKGILTGDMSGLDLIKIASKPTNVPGTVTGEPPAPGGPAAPAAAPEQPVMRRRLKEIGETHPLYQTADPGLVSALGYDPRNPVRNDDLIKQGYTGPIDAKDQRELTKKINETTAGAIDVMANASRAHQLFRGRPEVLGVVGAAARTVDQVIDQMKGAVQAVGGDMGSAGPGDEGLKTQAKNVAKYISDKYKAAGIEQTAVDSSRLQSAVLDMAYSSATARGIPGNRITNAILSQQLKQLGHGQSVAQFEATLADTVARATERVQRQISNDTGIQGFKLNLKNTSMNDLDVITKSPEMIPGGLKESLIGEIQSRLDVAAGKAQPSPGKPILRSSPTLEQEQSDVAKEEATRQRRLTFAEQRDQEKLQLERDRDLRATRAEISKLEAEKNRDEKEERRYQLALRKEERLAAHQRASDIGKAFAKLGEALGHSSSHQISAGGGGGGGDQDAGAFRIAPAPRRKGPEPVDAARYQPKAR
jgi:hypothetical protein